MGHSALQADHHSAEQDEGQFHWTAHIPVSASTSTTTTTTTTTITICLQTVDYFITFQLKKERMLPAQEQTRTICYVCLLFLFLFLSFSSSFFLFFSSLFSFLRHTHLRIHKTRTRLTRHHQIQVWRAKHGDRRAHRVGGHRGRSDGGRVSQARGSLPNVVRQHHSQRVGVRIYQHQ